MTVLPFLQKEDPELPDHYSIKIIFHNGSHEEFQVASHQILREQDLLEFVTHDDKWNLVPTGSFRRIEFDKNFSKIIALREKKKNDSANPV